MDTNPTQHDEDARPGDLLVGADAIRDYLIFLGIPDPDVYYLRRAGTWPIGSTAANAGGKLLASKRRLLRFVEKLARGSAPA